MAIYVSGDIHGTIDIDKLVHFFDQNAQIKETGEKNYLIILGDVGVCWDDGANDAQVLHTLLHLPVDKVLFIDGNHENFDLLHDYPVTTWNGGMVHEIDAKILHLMRGQIFEIEGKTFFTFGGATSIDKINRREGIDWWPEELPNEEEYERGRNILAEHHYAVDYILTHTAPREVIYELGFDDSYYEDEAELRHYLQEIAETVDFKAWFFGHFHEDESVDDTFHCLFYEIIKIP